VPYWQSFRRLPEMTAIIITEHLVCFQVTGEFSTTLQQVTVTIPRQDACTVNDRQIWAVVIYGGEGPQWVRGP